MKKETKNYKEMRYADIDETIIDDNNYTIEFLRDEQYTLDCANKNGELNKKLKICDEIVKLLNLDENAEEFIVDIILKLSTIQHTKKTMTTTKHKIFN